MLLTTPVVAYMVAPYIWVPSATLIKLTTVTLALHAAGDLVFGYPYPRARELRPVLRSTTAGSLRPRRDLVCARADDDRRL